MFRRIQALVLQEYFMTKHSLEIIIDAGVFPLMNLVLFGFVAALLGADGAHAKYLMAGVIFWEIIVVMQYNMTLSSLWNIWSHNLTNVFITPISTAEYLLAHALSALARAVLVIGLICLMAYVAFGFNIFEIDLATLLLGIFNMIVFAFWLGRRTAYYEGEP